MYHLFEDFDGDQLWLGIAGYDFVMGLGTGKYAGYWIEGTVTLDDFANDPETGGYAVLTLTGHVEGPNEILVPLETLAGEYNLIIEEGDTFAILDNDMTDGEAKIQIPAGTYGVYDQAGGTPGGEGEVEWVQLESLLNIRATKKPVWQQEDDLVIPEDVFAG